MREENSEKIPSLREENAEKIPSLRDYCGNWSKNDV